MPGSSNWVSRVQPGPTTNPKKGRDVRAKEEPIEQYVNVIDLSCETDDDAQLDGKSANGMKVRRMCMEGIA